MIFAVLMCRVLGKGPSFTPVCECLHTYLDMSTAVLSADVVSAEVASRRASPVPVQRAADSVTRLGDFYNYLATNCLTKVAQIFW